jgi:hypothetical protein
VTDACPTCGKTFSQHQVPCDNARGWFRARCGEPAVRLYDPEAARAEAAKAPSAAPFVLAVTRTATGSLELRLSKPTDLLPMTRVEALTLWEHLGQLLAVPRAVGTPVALRGGVLAPDPSPSALDAAAREQLGCLPGKTHKIVFDDGDVVPRCLHCEKLISAEAGRVLARLSEHSISPRAREWFWSHVTLREGSPGSGRYG